MSEKIKFPCPMSEWPIGKKKSETIQACAASAVDAAWQGCWAFKFGYSRCENPYPADSEFGKEWDGGFTLEETDKVYDDAAHHETGATP